MRYLSPVIAAALTLVCGVAFSAFVGLHPADAFHAFLFVKAAPLMLIATGLAIGFRSNIWNIGAEGQLTFGAICGGGLALYFHTSESAWLLPAMVVAGAVGGGAWAAVPGAHASIPTRSSSA
jgi:simple sugar transport system permease protein